MCSREQLDRMLYFLTILLIVSPLIAYISGFWITYWKLVTLLGEEQGYVALATLAYILVSPILGYVMLLSLLSTAWINVYLKNTLQLPRPPPDQWKISAEGYGFPSGHAQTSTAFWTAGYLYYKRPSIAVFSMSLITLISISRIVLGVHYPRDVIGGALIGLTVTLPIYFLSMRLFLLKKKYASTALLAYSFFVLFLSQLLSDLTLLRVAGVIAGASVFPYIREQLKLPESLSLRLLLAVGVLALSFALTWIARFLQPPLQFATYALIALIITTSPLVTKHLVSAFTPRVKFLRTQFY